MPTFISHGLTITVGEMSRSAALSCARDFNALIGLYPDDDSRLVELEVLCAIYAPAVAKTETGAISGMVAIPDGESSFDLTLPITHEIFDKLPYTLTREWIIAAVEANDWLIQDLKKAYSRIAQSIGAPPSGSGPSSEQTAALPTMKTTGTESTQTP